MITVNRRIFIVSVAAAASLAPGRTQATEADMMSIGRADARVHLDEYASATCPHCAAFHAENWDRLKSGYIDDGRVRLTLREIPTPPSAVSLAMFQLARCEGASAEEYFRRLGVLFQRQHAILETGTMAGVRDSLLGIGAEFGLTQPQVLACLNDRAGVDRITRSIEEAGQRGVTATPTFFMNGQRLDDDFQTSAGMVRILNGALERT